MAATSFWRKSALLWGILLSMTLTGAGSAMTYSDEGRGISLGLSISAFGMAAIVVIALVVAWVRHRRAGSSEPRT